MAIEVVEVKTVDELDVSGTLTDTDEMVIYQPAEVGIKTRKVALSAIKTHVATDLTTVNSTLADLQDQIDAIDTGGGGTPATISDPLIYVQTFEDGTNVSGIGTTQLLSSLTDPNTGVAYTNSSAGIAFPNALAMYGTISVGTHTYDDVVIAEAVTSVFASGRGTALYSASGRHYKCNVAEFVIPNTQGSGTKSRFRIIDFKGSIIEYDGSGGTVWVKTCANLTELQQAIDYRWIIRAMNLIGASRNDGSIGFDITGGRSCLFEDIEVKDFGTGFTGCTLLQSEWVRFNTAQCLVGFDAQINKVSGASAANQVWQPILINCRFRMIDTTAIGCNFRGVEFPKLIDCGWEGSDALYAVKYDNAGNAVAKKFLIERGRAEINNDGAGTFTGAFLYVTGSDFHYAEINGLEYQMNTPNATLVHAVISAGGTSRIYLKNISGNTSNNRWVLNHEESGAGNIAWDFQNVNLQGNPTTAANVIDTVTYPNIWVGGVTPILSRVYIKPYLI